MGTNWPIVALVALCGLQGALLASDEQCEDLKNKGTEIGSCCQSTEIIPLELDDACAMSKGASEGKELFMVQCSILCSYETFGIVDATGQEVDKAKLLEYANRIEDEAWKTTAVGIVEECSAHAVQLKEKMGNSGGRAGPCSPMAAMMTFCIGRKTLERCPADKWTDSDVCKLVKSGECFKKGKPM